jgi:hypothetical protein
MKSSCPKREALVHRYIKEGRKAIQTECEELGIPVQSVVNRAGDMGLFRTHRHNTEKDRRWKWAIERGSVVA